MIAALPHNVRRMLQALDAYWLHCDGLPKGRYPHSRSNDEDWWGRFEKYRAFVERDLGGIGEMQLGLTRREQAARSQP